MKREDLPLYHVAFGRALRVVAEFPDTDEGTKAANDYMAEHPGTGVLEVSGGRVILADNEDEGIRVDSPARRKICACCAGITRGSQWHNRDDGFGLCNDCIDFCARGATPEDFQRAYGLRGVHFDIQGATKERT